MSSISPDVIIFDGYGNPLAVQEGTAIPSNTSVILAGGSDGTNAHPLATNTAGQLQVTATEADDIYATFYPDQGNYNTNNVSNPDLDSFGNLMIRGPVLTDEGSFRDDFTGASLTTAITGNLTFTNGSLTVTGTNLQTQLRQGQYIKKTADSETLYVQISSIDTSTSLTLVSAYAGTTGAAASLWSNWQTVTPSGGSIVVASSIMTMTCGTTANAAGSLRSLGDFLPYSVQFYAAVSQRIANQTLYMGLEDVVGTPNQQAIVQFTGTSNTSVNFITSFSTQATEIQTTAVTLPNAATTASYNIYKIDLSGNQATLSINGVVVAKNTLHLPSPYTDLYITSGFINGSTAPASSTTFTIDNIYFEDVDRLQIDQDYSGEALPVATVDTSNIGTIAAVNATVAASTNGCSTIVFDVTGTWVASLFLQGQAGDGNWVNITGWSPTASNNLGSLFSNQMIIVPCGGFTQVQIKATGYTSGTAVVAWNVGSGTNFQQVIIGNTLPISIQGNAATGAAASGNPVLMGGENTGTGLIEPIGSVVDRSAMTAGTQTGTPVVGQSSGVGRLLTLSRFGYAIPGYQTLMGMDLVEGTTINSWLWTQATGTMTITQATGVLTLNGGAITTASTYALLSSNKQFAPVNQAPIVCSFKTLITQTTNAVNEIGFGTPTTNTAVVSNGAFFRVNASGTIHTVISFNGTETVSASLATIVTSSYYMFIVELGDQSARFIMEDENGIPLIDTAVPYLLANGEAIAVSHVPAFARVYITATAAGAAPQTKIASFQAYQYGINTSQPYSEQMGAAGRSSNISPTLFTQTLQSSAATNITAVTPSNTAVSWATLGGEYAVNMTATSANYLGLFGYQVPSPYTLIITDIYLPNPAVTTTLSTSASVIEFCLMIASSNNPSTATGYRYPIGIFAGVASLVAGSVLQGTPIAASLKTPITVLPGQYVLLMVKVLSGAATGVYQGNIIINGYWV